MTDRGLLHWGSWWMILGGLLWEVGAAGSIASMLGNDDPWQCVVLCSAVSRGLVSLWGAVWHPVG